MGEAKRRREALGATGRFPDGKLDETDEGEMRMAISGPDHLGNVRIDFGKPIAWFALPEAQAIDFALAILKRCRVVM